MSSAIPHADIVNISYEPIGNYSRYSRCHNFCVNFICALLGIVSIVSLVLGTLGFVSFMIYHQDIQFAVGLSGFVSFIVSAISSIIMCCMFCIV